MSEERDYLIEKDAGGWYILHKNCGKKSYYPTDIRERYCAWCKKFHEGET